MAGFEIKRTELVWPGKYDESGKRREVERVNLPFQVIERVNESRATREAAKERGATLFDVWEGDEGETFEEGWRNKLIWGDNLLVMSSLLEQGYAGKIDLIYIDPPFGTGADFPVETIVGESGAAIPKDQSVIEEKAYRDTWGKGKASWFAMMSDRLRLMRELLADSGSIYIHMDWYVGHHLRVVLDDVFGEDNSLGEVIWAYGSPSGGRVSGSKLVKAHDIIFIYARNYGRHRYTPYYLPYSQKYVRDWFRYDDGDGRLYQKRQRIDKQTGERYWEKQYLDESRGVPASTVWSDIQQAYADPRAYKVGTTSELTGYPTQKPEKLLERVISISSSEGDLVADFFCGSGTTMAVAERLGRRWIGSDLGRFAVNTSRKRLLDVPGCRPFEVLNLGRYERQYWSVATFGEDLDEDGAISLLEYVAFILKLYGATPMTGSQHVHGQTGDAFVHVGAVDAPVTFDEVMAAVAECAELKAGELHVLGWEWEMGLNDLVSDEAKKQGVKIVLRQIPREVMEAEAARKGDVQFFELAYLEASVELTKAAREYEVKLENFVIPNPELVPDDVREKITKWSDYVDYWAVDWDFRDDTFMQGWVTYRTRKNRKLELISDPHVYEEPGEYRVMIKVIDVFGNDTSKLVMISVR